MNMNDETIRSQKSEHDDNRLDEYVDFVRSTIKRLAPTGQKRWTTPEAVEEALRESYFATTYKDLGYDTFDHFLRDVRFEDFWVVEKDAEGKDAVRIRLRREIAQYLKGVTDTITTLYRGNHNEPITIDCLNEALRGTNYAVTYTDLGYSSFEVFLTDSKRFSKFWNSEKTSDYSILLAPAGVNIPYEAKGKPIEQPQAAPSHKKNEEVTASTNQTALSEDAVRIAQRVEGAGRLLFDAEGWVEISKLETRVPAAQLQRVGFDTVQAFVEAYADRLGWEVQLRGEEKIPSLRIKEENLKATPLGLIAHKETPRTKRTKARNEEQPEMHRTQRESVQQSEPVQTDSATESKQIMGCGETKCGAIPDHDALLIKPETLQSLMDILAPQYAAQFADDTLELYLRYHLTLYFYRLYGADALVIDNNNLLFNTGLLDNTKREIVAVLRDVRHLEGSEPYELVSFRQRKDALHHDEGEDVVPEGGKRFFMLVDQSLTREQMLLSGLKPMEKSAFKDILPSQIEALATSKRVDELCTCVPPRDRQNNEALCEAVAAAYEAKRMLMIGEAPRLYPLMYDVKAREFYSLLSVELNGANYCLAIAYKDGQYRPVTLCTFEEALMRTAPLSWPRSK